MYPIRYAATLAAALLAALAAPGCGGSSAGRDEPAAARHDAGPVYVDVTRDAGITHTHRKPELDPRASNIMPWLSSVGAAAAAGDYDGDGRIDLYVTNSHKGTPNFLYRNNGDGTFEDRAAAAGLAAVNDDGGASMDCIWADLDNDGRLDLYLVRWGRDLVFHNNGDGTFRDVTAERFRGADGGPGTPWANGNAVIALDYDLDGRLDLYVGNYFDAVDLWHLESTRIMHDDFEVARNAGRNQLWHQRADGSFIDVAPQLGLDDPGWTLAAGSADVNNDGWPDLYLANDFGPDQLFLNDGAGGFVNVSEQAIGRDTRKGMNVDFGDFNNDGWLDIYVTNITTAEYLQEGNMLWRNNGPGKGGVPLFMDVAPESQTYDGGWGWGGKFLDYDNDGDLDLFSVNGFISAGEGNYWYDLASWTVLDKDPTDALNWPTIGDRSFSGYEAYRFWRNDGFETFKECAAELGLASVRDGRGIVVLDYDDDGDEDLFVANQGEPPHLFRNDSPHSMHWLTLRLAGDPATGTNADAIGTRVTAITAEGLQIRERDGGNGYSGQSEPRIHFGLGSTGTVELLEVRWPDGGLQYLENVAADQFVDVRQDPSRYAGRSRLSIDAPTPRTVARAEPERLVPEIDPVELDRLLTRFEQDLRANPGNHALAYSYRRNAADHGKHERAIEFFERRVKEHPEDRDAKLELSVAHIDKIPTCGGIAAIVCKGTLARRSLDPLDALIAGGHDGWLERYARGMNHLHWPRALRHTPAAVEDFTRCLELQERDPAGLRPYHERTFVLLGDAHAKNRSYTEARRIWGRGLRDFPRSRALQERTALGDDDDALQALVERERSLERPIDTDLSFLER